MHRSLPACLFVLPVFKRALEELAGVAFLALGDLLGRAGDDDLPAAIAALRAQINHVIAGLDDVQIMLDDEHGIACVRQTGEHLHKPVAVGHVQAGRGLVEHIERLTRGGAG